MIVNKGNSTAGGVDTDVILGAVTGKFGRAATDANGDPIDWEAAELLGTPVTTVPAAPGAEVKLRPARRVTFAKAAADAIVRGTPGLAYLDAEGLAQSEGVVELGERTGDVLIDGSLGVNFTFTAAGACTVTGIINAVPGRKYTVYVGATGSSRNITMGGECQFTAAALPGGANPVAVATTETFIFEIFPNVEAGGTRRTFIRNTDRVTNAALSAPVMQSVVFEPSVGVAAGTFIIRATATGNPAPTFDFAAKRNDVAFGVTNNNDGTATLQLGAGQQGALDATVIATNSQGSSAPLTGYGRAGRLIPTLRGSTINSRTETSGTENSEFALAAGSLAGEECVVTCNNQVAADYAFAAGFTIVGYVPRISSTPSANHYWVGIAHKTIRDVDAAAGKMLADDNVTPLTMVLQANSQIQCHTIIDFDSIDWDGTFNRAGGGGAANAVDLKTRTVLNSLLLVPVFSGDYKARYFTTTPTFTDYFPGIADTTHNLSPGSKGHMTFSRKVGAGTLGARTIQLSGAADLTITTLTLVITAPDD